MNEPQQVAQVIAERVAKSLGGRQVLAGVDLRVETGEAVAVLGPSGSGKSTLMAVLGLLTSRDSGNLSIQTIEIPATRRARARVRRLLGISWVPQVPMVLPGRTVLDNVLVSVSLARDLDDADLGRARGLLSEMQLDGVAELDAAVLSGGEMQRLAVARALFHGAPLILADEPTASLDQANTRRVVESFRAKSCNQTLVVATHDSRVADACTRIVSLRDGIAVEVS